MKECTGQLMANMSEEKLEAHYEQMLTYSIRSFNSYIETGVVKGKYWYIGNEQDKYYASVCGVCRENAKVGVIPLKAKFPSGHLYPPAGKLCRCSLQPAVSEWTNPLPYSAIRN